jgi:PhnB protein
MTMTRQHLVPYINFQGQAREAMEFYQRVLGGTLLMVAGGEQGRPRPAEPGDRIMHARLEAGGTDEARLRAVFDGLAYGGQVKMPLTKQPWGIAGWLTDRFGINWNIDVEAG